MKKWIICFEYDHKDTVKEWVESENKPCVEEAKQLLKHQNITNIIYIKEMKE